MVALAAYEDDELCPVCGGPKSVCQAPENEGRFETGPPVRCHVTTAISQAQEAYKDARAPRALMWGARFKG